MLNNYGYCNIREGDLIRIHNRTYQVVSLKKNIDKITEKSDNTEYRFYLTDIHTTALMKDENGNPKTFLIYKNTSEDLLVHSPSKEYSLCPSCEKNFLPVGEKCPLCRKKEIDGCRI